MTPPVKKALEAVLHGAAATAGTAALGYLLDPATTATIAAVLPAKYMGAFIVLLAAARAGQNYWKHRNDDTFVRPPRTP